MKFNKFNEKYDEKAKIEIECTESAAKELLKLLNYFGAQGNIGYTADFKVDNKWFTFDGDGSDRISSIKHNGKEYRK